MRAAGAGECTGAGRPAVTPETDHVTDQGGHTGPVPARYRLEALSPRERDALTALANSATGPARSVQRAQALLALSSGLTASEVARQVGRCPRTIARWRARFAQEGVTAVFDAARSGAPPRLSTQDVLTICETAVAEPRSVGLELQCWSLRRLSDHLAMHLGIVVRHERLRQILRAHGVSRKAEVSSQRSTDPQFVEKRDAVLRLYTQPPEDSVVVCLDQHGPVSLHGTQGQKYAAPGQTPHHDAEYKRHGTIYALGALLPHVGTVFVRAFAHYNSLTVIWFLGWLLPQLPDKRNIYIILDNASAHTAKRVADWLHKHWGERVHLVFTPSKAAWLNLIEPFWRVLKDEMIMGSDFQSRSEFRSALRRYVPFYNRRCHPFIWGRQRKARVLLVRPLRQKLRGRAGARSMPPRLLRLIARAA